MNIETRQRWGTRQRVGLYAAPVLAGLVYVVPMEGVPAAVQTLSAVMVWVVVCWTTEALPLAMTALIGAALCVVLGLGSAKDVLATFAHPIIFLFLGSFLLAEAFVVHGLDRRCAVWLVSRPWLRGRPAAMVGAMGLTTAGLSMWISNTASVAIMLPVALGVLSTMRGVGGMASTVTGAAVTPEAGEAVTPTAGVTTTATGEAVTPTAGVTTLATGKTGVSLYFAAASGDAATGETTTGEAVTPVPSVTAVSGEMAPTVTPAPATGETGVLLWLAYGSAAGGIATMIGTPPNLIAVGLLSQQAGVSLSFIEWMGFGLPLAVVLAGVVAAVLWWLHPLPRAFPPEGEPSGNESPGNKSPGNKPSLAAPPSSPPSAWTRGQVYTCGAFALAVGCWVVPGLLGVALGRDADVVAFLHARLPKEVAPILAAGLLFVIPVNLTTGERVLTWAQASRIDWGTMLLFGGGLTFGRLMVDTGLAAMVGEGVLSLFGHAASDEYARWRTLWLLTAVAIGLTVALTELVSNTASASMLVPVVIAVAVAAGVSPIPPTLGVCLGASLAFMMPVATAPNAMVYGTGLVPITAMLKAGLVLNVLGAGLIWLMLYLLCPWLGLA